MERLDFEKMLDELYALTELENDRELTKKESEKYMELVQCLQDNEIEIDFAINY
ncbi:hypothetical protein vBBceHLY2_00128 [Bacillus phage vB_BceH_LY2]|nr:hypothetical protein vBBceHLY2_00128 [Bacillus phage vB_BceH_LY2]